jgi:hypothetical protein
MNLPQFKLLVESITDRNALMDAIKSGDKEGAMKAISSLMKNKKVYNTPAQELGVEESEYRTIVNAVRAGDLKKAGEAMGIGDEYTQRGPFAAKTAPTGKKTAKFIRKIPRTAGDARLYQLSEPLKDSDWRGGRTYEYVLVSKVKDAMGGGPETYIFGVEDPQKGLPEPGQWMELDGSQRGEVTHEEALKDAGYEVV